MASLGLWTLPFCGLARIFPTFCSVVSLTIELTPLFSSNSTSTEWVFFPPSGDRYNTETAGASYWSPRTWLLDDNFGLRAEAFAPRSDAPRDSGQPERVRPRQEAWIVGPAPCRLPCNPAKDPTQASSSRRVRSTLRQHVENFASLALHIYKHSSASSQRKSGIRPYPFFGISGKSGFMPQGTHTGIKTLTTQ